VRCNAEKINIIKIIFIFTREERQGTPDFSPRVVSLRRVFLLFCIKFYLSVNYFFCFCFFYFTSYDFHVIVYLPSPKPLKTCSLTKGSVEDMFLLPRLTEVVLVKHSFLKCNASSKNAKVDRRFAKFFYVVKLIIFYY